MTNALFFQLKLTFLSLLTFLVLSSTGYSSQSVEAQVGAAKDNIDLIYRGGAVPDSCSRNRFFVLIESKFWDIMNFHVA